MLMRLGIYLALWVAARQGGESPSRKTPVQRHWRADMPAAWRKHRERPRATGYFTKDRKPKALQEDGRRNHGRAEVEHTDPSRTRSPLRPRPAIRDTGGLTMRSTEMEEQAKTAVKGAKGNLEQSVQGLQELRTLAGRAAPESQPRRSPAQQQRQAAAASAEWPRRLPSSTSGEQPVLVDDEPQRNSGEDTRHQGGTGADPAAATPRQQRVLFA